MGEKKKSISSLSFNELEVVGCFHTLFYLSLQPFTCGWKPAGLELLLAPILSPGTSLGPRGSGRDEGGKRGGGGRIKKY